MTRFIFWVIRMNNDGHKALNMCQEITVVCWSELVARTMLENTPGLYDITLITTEVA